MAETKLKKQSLGTLENPVINFTDLTATMNVKCRAYLSGQQTIGTGSWTKITFQTESYDIGSDYDNSTNYRFVAPVTGYYLVISKIVWAAMANSDYYVAIYKQGTSYTRADWKPGAGTNFTVSISEVVPLAANEYVETFVYQNTGGNVDVGSGAVGSSMSVHLLNI